MSKKLISLILSVVMLVSIFTGCTLFKENVEKNMKQVVAEIGIIEETVVVGGQNLPYSSQEKKYIYKYQLVESLNNNGSQLLQNGATLEEAAAELLENLVVSELVIIDIEKQKAFGDIDWRDGKKDYASAEEKAANKVIRDYTDKNAIYKLVYNAIDSSLKTIRNEILTERGLDLPEATTAEDDSSSSTTYPIQEIIDPADKDRVVREKDDFLDEIQNTRSRWPGYYGDEADKSLGRETMRRFLALLKDRVDPKNNYAVMSSDTDKFKTDDTKINDIINGQGIEYVYPMLWKTHYLKFLVEKNAERQVMINRLGEQLSKAVVVTDNEVKTAFNAKVTAQKLSFDADASAYATAVRGGENIYYNPNNRFFYVKHILLPFNAAQSEKLSAFKSSGKRTPQQIEAYRRTLVNEIKVYPHVNGEDDLDNPTTVNAVFKQIKAEMAGYGDTVADLRAAERTFDKFIYKYNTDSGIFNQPKGYAEVSELQTGESETYMPEFAKLARELYKDYRPGQVHTDFAITDYGVHIMYYASKTYAGHEVSYNDYQTPGEYRTYFDIIKEELEKAREEEEFNKWRDRTIVYYENILEITTKYEKRYADLLKQ